MLRFLLDECGVSVATHKYGTTLLHFAAFGGFRGLCEDLLQRGADRAAKNRCEVAMGRQESGRELAHAERGRERMGGGGGEGGQGRGGIAGVYRFMHARAAASALWWSCVAVVVAWCSPLLLLLLLRFCCSECMLADACQPRLHITCEPSRGALPPS